VLIGELATRVDMTAKALRFYESRGLLTPERRTPAGYRDYDETAVARVRFVKSAQAAGFTLREIAAVLGVRDRGQAPCTHVQALIVDHLHDIEHRLEKLRATRAELFRLARNAQTIGPDDCPPESICRILERR
jgi:DNA-binding transcriptional MerR regulator